MHCLAKPLPDGFSIQKVVPHSPLFRFSRNVPYDQDAEHGFLMWEWLKEL